MLLECANCGAPLDVKPGASISKCAYCGKSSAVGAMRTLAEQTPPQWSPPRRWQPPAHVPADSNVELPYRARQSRAGCIVGAVMVLATGIPIAIVLAKTSGCGGLAPEKLDAVTFAETPSAMQDEVGGSYTQSAHWVTVPLSSPFQLAVFEWGDDETHPTGLSLNFAGEPAQCTPEREAIRARLRGHLGPRFDGSSWRWGPISLYFDPKCGNLGISASTDAEPAADWKGRLEVLWRLVRADALGRPLAVSPAELAGVLGNGYPAATIGPAIAGLTTDTARRLAQSLHGTYFDTSGELTAHVPLAHPKLGEVELTWKNEANGPLERVYVNGYGGKLPTHGALAKCVAQRTGGALQVVEADHLKGETREEIKLPGLDVNTNTNAIYAYAAGSALSMDQLQKMLVAIDGCKD